MPILHVTSSPERSPDSLLSALADRTAAALGIESGHVFVHRVDARLLDARGGHAAWTAVIAQGDDYGADAERAACDAIRESWPDRRVSVAWLHDAS